MKGESVELLTAARMRAIEQAAIAGGKATGLDLMERAGLAVVAAALEEWPELARSPRACVVLCGPGNNGGDGFVAARVLQQKGWQIEVYHFGDQSNLPPDALTNYQRWAATGQVRPWDATAIAAASPDLFIDAVFGTGLTRPTPNEVAAPLLFFTGRNRTPSKTLSIDVPSGLCADSGRVLGGDTHRLRADLTVTFHRPKIGHYLAEGPGCCGKLVCADIGIGAGADPAANPVVLITGDVLGFSAIADMRQSGQPHQIDKAGDGHKYLHGHALIVSGGPGRGGAARLAARGALRIGAGLVTVACPPEALAEHAARLDAVMLRAVVDAEDLEAALADKRMNALCLGPGLGLDARAVGLVGVALESPPPLSPPHEGEGNETRPAKVQGSQAVAKTSPLLLVGRRRGTKRPVVLDADALTILSQTDLFAALHPYCVLTPHAGEFARLFPDIAAKLNATAAKGPAYSKVDATREAALRAGCIVVFKGPDTVIAGPDGSCSISAASYARAAPWLATAGAGDVLAGFITGLLARGFSPMRAAEMAAWLHVECARSFGPGLIAEDLPNELPPVFRAIGL